MLLQEQSDLGPHCLSILVDDKKHTFCDYSLLRVKTDQ